MLLKAAEADGVLEDYDDLGALLGAAGNTEADFTSYARKTLTDAELAAVFGDVGWLIDPAAHGGHREFDLAMMRLFGGFGSDCFAAYDEASPLADGWQERIALHQLAPLAVHAIKFGGGYVEATARAAARYR